MNGRWLPDSLGLDKIWEGGVENVYRAVYARCVENRVERLNDMIDILCIHLLSVVNVHEAGDD